MRVLFWLFGLFVFIGCQASEVTPSVDMEVQEKSDVVGKPFVQMGYEEEKNVLKASKNQKYLAKDRIAKKEALLVGVSDYGNGKGEISTKYDLKGVAHDMVKMKILLKKLGFTVTECYNKKSLNLWKELHKATKTLGEEDQFVFYFTGHGSQTEDENGDEEDGKDETIVLSDGKVNRKFLDDGLNSYFNEIKARKLLIFDSCHSNTAFKRFGDKPVAKAISSKAIDGTISTRKVSTQNSKLLNKSDYVVLSAAKDYEKSLVDKHGSFFTTALVDYFETYGVNREFQNIEQHVNKAIKTRCKKSDSKVHHSSFSFSKDGLKFTTLKHYFMSNKRQKISDKNGLTIQSKKLFSEGEEVKFKINTHGKKGYVTVFGIENGNVAMHYASNETYKGVLNYPKKFGIEGLGFTKESKINIEEKVVMYVVLSENPVSIHVGGANALFPFSVKSEGGKVWKQRFEIGIY